METEPVRQGVVTTDRDQDVDLLVFEDAEHVWGDVDDPLLARLVAEKGRNFLRSHLARVGPGGVEEGSTGAIDGSDHTWDRVGSASHRSIWHPRVEVSQPAPAAADADHLMALFCRPVHHRLDASVEPGHVSTTGQDSDSHGAGA